MILHGACHVEGRVRDCINANFNMPLFNIHDSILDRLRHLHLLHKDRESAPSERTDIDFLARGKSLSPIDYAHLVELRGQLVSLCNSVVIILAQCLQLSDKFGALTDYPVVLYVVFTVLNVVASEHSDLSQAGVFLPLEEVDLFEQLLLVILQFTH